jgi:hypothetical protein
VQIRLYRIRVENIEEQDSHSIRALLRPAQKSGLVIGRAKFNVFVGRAETLIADHPELVAAARPLLKARQGGGAAGRRSRPRGSHAGSEKVHNCA